jgi:hypothetical protein
LADLLHLRPDDFPIPWFLDYVFGTDPPEDSIVTAGLKLNEDNIAELVAKCDIPYRYIRKKVSPRLLPEPVRVSIAQYTDLDTLIWYYEGTKHRTRTHAHDRTRALSHARAWD